MNAGFGLILLGKKSKSSSELLSSRVSDSLIFFDLILKTSAQARTLCESNCLAVTGGEIEELALSSSSEESILITSAPVLEFDAYKKQQVTHEWSPDEKQNKKKL